jgi:hypothetical protein
MIYEANCNIDNSFGAPCVELFNDPNRKAISFIDFYLTCF